MDENNVDKQNAEKTDQDDVQKEIDDNGENIANF